MLQIVKLSVIGQNLFVCQKCCPMVFDAEVNERLNIAMKGMFQSRRGKVMHSTKRSFTFSKLALSGIEEV